MHFLFITYYLPPEGTTAAQRIWRWTSALYQAGHTISAVGKTNNKLPTLEKRPLPPGRYLRTYAVDYRSLQAANKSLPTTPSQHTGLLRKAMDSFPLNLLIGEGACLWIALAYFKAAKSISKDHPQVLITSFRPAADHIIGYLLKSRFPHLIWVADFRDMPPLSEKQVFWKKLQRKFWTTILAKADQLTAVSKGITNQLAAFNPNTYVLYNAAFPDSELPGVNKNLPWPKDNITLLYTGSWFPNQSLQPLLETLLTWEHPLYKLQVVYCGKDAAYWQAEFTRHKIQDQLINLGMVDAQTARYYQSKSHVNLLFTWNDPQNHGILTSKLFDYLNYPNPILCFTKGLTDPELNEITSSHPHVLLADDTTSAMTIQQWIANTWNTQEEQIDYSIPHRNTWLGQISPWTSKLTTPQN